MDNSKNRHNSDHLGVNKIGKNIRKSPLHQPNFANTNTNTITANDNPARQQPQPRVYNISKNDFRNIVQQLTGSPSHDPLPRPPSNPPKSQNMRLQKIRPPPLTPFSRPHIPTPAPVPATQPAVPPVPYNNFPRPAQFGGPPQPAAPMPPPGDPRSHNPIESHISAYMRYLQTSILDPSPAGNLPVPPPQPQALGQPPPSSGVHPNPPPPALLSPRFSGLAMPPNANLPPHMNNLAPFPSPNSQFPLPSPSSYLNLLSPRSPYPLLSPGVQFPPLSPNFAFSPISQSALLGPGYQLPPSPGLMFPPSPSGFFAMPSPRWRDQ